MTSLHLTDVRMPIAEVGPENPLPPVQGLLGAPYQLRLDDMPEEIRRNAAYGGVRTVMPYLMQDDYDRERRPGSMRMAVLENAHLRAEFALDLGGRLWSLTHVPTGRELLFNNPVAQPGNLALRGAWLAGGVEWNIGTRGHSPTTCAPLHAGRVEGPGGVTALRMWEWERIRGVLFQIDVWLAEDKPLLYVHVRLRAPEEVPIYWWSNIAVPETPGLRVIAPATRAFHTSYAGELSTVEVGPWTSPTTCEYAGDYFFDVPERPWIAALDSDGHGLAQVSTAALRGRKLFVWGQSPGGRRWAEWLTEPGAGAYAEIQAGLAATQYEHVPLRGELRWLEAYGPLSVEPSDAHGDWTRAVAETGARIEEWAPAQTLDALLDEASQWLDLPPAAILHQGSGWGALEEPKLDTTGTPLGSPGPDQEPWKRLLVDGELPDEPPRSYVTGPAWRERLDNAPRTWATAYHLATIAHADGDEPTARARYTESIALRRTPWAVRGLAVLDGSADLLQEAFSLAPDVWQLAVELACALLDSGRAGEALGVLDGLPAATRERGRIQLLTVRATLAAGETGRARALLRAGVVVPDLREGEISFDDLWAAAFPGEALPPVYDFRMRKPREDTRP